ncbi:MAG: glycosyltransferase family 2 protein, partial [Solirubrobacteraceae bacterium]
MTVAVVSFQTRKLLLDCLAALRADVDAGRIRVCVVDNRSTDGSAAAAREHAPWAEVITPERNLGFGAAVNLVAARSASPWLLAANADIAPHPGALAQLLAAGTADPRAGAVAPRLILPDGATQHSVGPFPSVALAVTFALGAHRLSPRLADRLCLDDHWDPRRARTVPWALAACLLLRRAAFDAIGGFDARQWMYAEDLDFGWRLRD